MNDLLTLTIAIWIGFLATIPGCHPRSVEAFDSLRYNFTLAALNTTGINTNTTGSPLVLGAGGATSGLYFYVTSTYASFPYNDYPTLGLVDGGLRAYSRDGGWRTNATDVQSLGNLGWVTTVLYAHAAAPVYQAMVDPDQAYEYPLLGPHSFHNLWSLCPSTNRGGQVVVVFNVTAEAVNQPYLGYDPAKCYGVVLQIVPYQTTASGYP